MSTAYIIMFKYFFYFMFFLSESDIELDFFVGKEREKEYKKTNQRSNRGYDLLEEGKNSQIVRNSFLLEFLIGYDEKSTSNWMEREEKIPIPIFGTTGRYSEICFTILTNKYI